MDFHDRQADAEFSMKLGGVKRSYRVVNSEFDSYDQWYILMQNAEDNKVVQISFERFRKIIPSRMSDLAEKFDDWFDSIAKVKFKFVAPDFCKFLSDREGMRITGDKPLSTDDLLKLREDKRKKEKEEFEATKKRMKMDADYLYTPRGRTSFKGMC
jgi:hypothetical protein